MLWINLNAHITITHLKTMFKLGFDSLQLQTSPLNKRYLHISYHYKAYFYYFIILSSFYPWWYPIKLLFLIKSQVACDRKVIYQRNFLRSIFLLATNWMDSFYEIVFQLNSTFFTSSLMLWHYYFQLGWN